MFTTTNPETLHTIAQSYRVHWLVARPGTDIALPRPLPSWLVEQSDSGDLKIYRVD
jgi:anaerobic selenocysteine-containing dehydrogenase